MKALFKTDLMAYITPPHVQRGQVHGHQHLQVDGHHVDGRGLGPVGRGMTFNMPLNPS